MLPTRAFVDTSALVAAILSDQGGGRMILRLGEAGAVQIVVGRQVLAEMEGALRRKAPGALASLALLLDRVRMEVAPDPAPGILAGCDSLVDHRGDAMVLAAAVGGRVDYFVTLDRQHFLANERLCAAVPFEVGTPGDFLAWFRARISGARV